MDSLHRKCDRAFEILGPEADAVLIVPPFADYRHPSLGVHLLQAAAGEAGLRVRVLYANLLFATLSGEGLYTTISCQNGGWLWGERVFAAAAFGLPPLGYETDKLREELTRQNPLNSPAATFDQMAALESEAGPFCAALGERLAALRCRVIGATANFQQTAASVALLAQVKRTRPRTITAIGGANCAGVMAQGIASLSASIDYIFAGECECVFRDFLRRAMAGEPLPPDRIVRGEACLDLDSLPEPCFEDYFAQLENALPNWREGCEISSLYESSRGCWWGARQPCTFCGYNGETLTFRQKSPERVIAGIKRLLLRYPTRLVAMTDNILPHAYFRTLLPQLAEESLPVRIFYETRSSLSFEQVQLLRRAGVACIQPGIEALSSSLLRRMGKGVLARQNLALLRYARAAGMLVTWNLLTGFPGDKREDYDSTLALIPLIRHLPPPMWVSRAVLSRFSSYANKPDAYGITGLRPPRSYAWIFPSHADLESLASQYDGDFACAHNSYPELQVALEQAHREWREGWKVGAPAPALHLTPGNEGYYTLLDTRGLEGTAMFQLLDEEQARAVLIGGPLERQRLASWAIERKLAVALDGWCAPLATTDVETWRRWEARTPEAVQNALATPV